MAWVCKEEEAMDIIGKHMGVMRLEKKKELSEIYTKLIFPRHGLNWTNVKWTTHWGVTFVTMWDEEHLLKNIQYTMLMEVMGIGPMKYCIVFNKMPNFFNKLLLLFLYLPHKKMCFYPPRFFFDAPFDHSQGWRSEMQFVADGFISRIPSFAWSTILSSLLYMRGLEYMAAATSS